MWQFTRQKLEGGSLRILQLGRQLVQIPRGDADGVACGLRAMQRRGQ
eukprot:CAMPEP_0115539162 /NCGR_PEP_ID=MMETSP0271-20121206/89262_1 /TAXON_ID=71861 /ORGANISM="Scrippsiella trochoidea, Strain CCMP3099" /LENGTH=46 /DNA_ID= /DNA_START= /DNA_END= /DNA_ORIENTATION=